MCATEAIVTLSDAGKRYVKYDDVPALVTGLIRWSRGSRRSKLWAVRHVDLEVQRGEALGVIGRNGAGKSTMLAMLAGVTAPTEGVVAVRGRVAPLLRLGVGFHKELTGRENVYINATMLGLTEAEIDRVFDEIVSFAELEAFIDTPVNFYSSGMMARLGFAVAISSGPDVLLVDEILAVGDLTFQIRSFERMVELQREGSTIVVVSHNLEAVARLCSRVLVLNDGTPRFLGSAPDGISHYHELMRVDSKDLSHSMQADVTPADGDSPLELLGTELLDDRGLPTAYFDSGALMTVRLHVRFRRSIGEGAAGLRVMNQANQLVYLDTDFRLDMANVAAGAETDLDILIALHLPSGTYNVEPWMGWGTERGEQVIASPHPFYVTKGPSRGQANLGARYSLAATTLGPEAGKDDSER